MPDEDADRFLREIIHDGEALEFSLGEQPVVHEIHRPGLIRRRGPGPGHARKPRQFLALPPPNLKLFLDVDSLRPLMIFHRAFFSQNGMEPGATPTLVFPCKLFQASPEVFILGPRDRDVVKAGSRQLEQAAGP